MYLGTDEDLCRRKVRGMSSSSGWESNRDVLGPVLEGTALGVDVFLIS